MYTCIKYSGKIYRIAGIFRGRKLHDMVGKWNFAEKIFVDYSIVNWYFNNRRKAFADMYTCIILYKTVKFAVSCYRVASLESKFYIKILKVHYSIMICVFICTCIYLLFVLM